MAHLEEVKQTKHTPGPWKIVDSRKCIGIDMDACDHNFQIADKRDHWVANVNKGLPNDEGNARLIAAAPELLEALMAVRDDIINAHRLLGVADSSYPILRNIQEVIKKATTPHE